MLKIKFIQKNLKGVSFLYFLIGLAKRINCVYSGMAMFAHTPLTRHSNAYLSLNFKTV